MKNIKTLMFITLVLSIGLIGLASAGDLFRLKNSTGTPVFIFSTTSKNLTVLGNISAGLFFVGDGRYLTNIVANSLTANSTTISYKNITDTPACSAGQYLTNTAGTWSCGTPTITANSTTLDYHNITGVPTCGTGTYVTMAGNGGAWACTALASNTITIAGENITSGTIAFARLPTLTSTHTHAYQNITGVPTCTAGQFVKMNATGWICETPAGGSFTNVAYYNNTQTWALDQVFTNDINVTSDINLLSASAAIKRGTTNITIDDTGNVDITLGG